MDAQDGGDRLAGDEVEDLRRNLQEQEQQHLRLLADFENFRRRIAREQEGRVRRAGVTPCFASCLRSTHSNAHSQRARRTWRSMKESPQRIGCF